MALLEVPLNEPMAAQPSNAADKHLRGAVRPSAALLAQMLAADCHVGLALFFASWRKRAGRKEARRLRPNSPNEDPEPVRNV